MVVSSSLQVTGTQMGLSSCDLCLRLPHGHSHDAYEVARKPQQARVWKHSGAWFQVVPSKWAFQQPVELSML